jgi:hypothetical protein
MADITLTTDNSFVGVNSGASLTTGTGNCGFGTSTLTLLTTGNNNIASGHRSGLSLTTGADNAFFGFIAGQLGTTAAQNTAAGSKALQKNQTGQRNVAVGFKAGSEYLASDMTAVGSEALWKATGASNTGVGASAGGSVTTGQRNVFIGYGAGAGPTTPGGVSYAIAIGYNVQAISSGMIVLGDANQTLLQMFGLGFARYNAPTQNLTIGGTGSSPVTWTGTANLGIGKGCFSSATTASSNLAVGQSAFEDQIIGNGNCIIGQAAARHTTAAFDCTCIGNIVAENAVSGGTGLTAVGFRAAQFATAMLNNALLGDSAAWRSQGNNVIAIGYRVAEYNGSGDDCIYIGKGAGVNRESGNRNILIGTEAGAFSTAPVVPNDNNGTVTGTVAGGDRTIGIGFRALDLCTGSDHVALGDQAGLAVTSGSDCVFVGSAAGNDASQKVDAVNSIAIGSDTFTTADNQVVLGNASITETVLRGVQKGTVLTVATLPAAGSSAGSRAFVSDSNAAASGNFGAAVAAGGANTVPVYCDGAAWRIG